jgi:hypothetical protein
MEAATGRAPDPAQLDRLSINKIRFFQSMRCCGATESARKPRCPRFETSVYIQIRD